MPDSAEEVQPKDDPRPQPTISLNRTGKNKDRYLRVRDFNPGIKQDRGKLRASNRDTPGGFVMHSCRGLLSAAPLLLLIAISGCGGGGGDQVHTNDEVVSVAPPTATVSAGGQVTLQASVSGCGGAPCPAPAFTWAIGELQTNGATGAQCNWQGATPPPGPCPNGTIEGADTPPFVSVTFHAPSTPGTIHVLAQVFEFSNPPVVKTGTAVITVP